MVSLHLLSLTLTAIVLFGALSRKIIDRFDEWLFFLDRARLMQTQEALEILSAKYSSSEEPFSVEGSLAANEVLFPFMVKAWSNSTMHGLNEFFWLSSAG